MYFGAHWAPPSRLFTERLIGFNQIIKNSFQERFQVVFISDDGDQDAFGRNFNLMPWAALHFDKTEIKMTSNGLSSEGLGTNCVKCTKKKTKIIICVHTYSSLVD